MASFSSAYFSSSTCCTEQNPRKLFCRNSRFLSSYSSYRPFPHTKTPFPSSARAPSTGICRCESRSDSQSPCDDSIGPRWNSLIQHTLKNAVERWKDHVNRHRIGLDSAGEVAPAEKEKARTKEEEGGGDWDWDRWRRHFDEVEEQERIVSILKLQLGDAVQWEDYDDAAKLKVAMAAASRNDTVGRAMSLLKRAVVEERYQDAAFIRDHAGAGLVGWWAGVSEDSADPYGRIIHITAEHGRYLARSYNSRQLASASPGVPLFEVFFTVNNKGEYKHQAVYLKRNRGSSGEFLSGSLKSSDVSHLNSSTDLAEEESGLSSTSADDTEGEEKDSDSDVAGSQSIVQDMIPGFKFNVPKVVVPGNMDGDLIFKALEQESEEEEDRDSDVESIELDDELKAESEEEDGERNMDFENAESYNELKAESDRDEIEMDAGGGYGDSSKEERKMVVKFFLGTLTPDLSSEMSARDLLRVPASIEKKGRLSFSFSMKKDGNRQDPGGKGQASPDTSGILPGHRNIDHIMSNLTKVLFSKDRKPKISMKVLKNVGDLLHLTLNQAQSRQSLSGSTVFNRIEIPATSDPLNGLYIGSHGLYSSGIIHLKRKFGQWQEDSGIRIPSNLEFYEYVEALKLTGDPYVPAGQVAFRAKIGKRNQLPHKGIIPEEFGVVARYRGQGRLAESGFRNPRWVDGELVVLDGKYSKGGPVVGFVYWVPEYQFLVFFNRLKLQD